MTERPIHSFTPTEQRILAAKERFDETLRSQPEMPQEERADRWRGFLAHFDADLKAIGWRRPGAE